MKLLEVGNAFLQYSKGGNIPCRIYDVTGSTDQLDDKNQYPSPTLNQKKLR